MLPGSSAVCRYALLSAAVYTVGMMLSSIFNHLDENILTRGTDFDYITSSLLAGS
jgi:hypothetical protein